MSRLYTRRAFLSLAGATVTVVGLMKLFHISAADRIPAEGRCPKCGIELTKRAYDLALNDRFHLVLKHRRRNKRAMAWEWAQVPFPNARLIRQSDKPAITFSEMQI